MSKTKTAKANTETETETNGTASNNGWSGLFPQMRDLNSPIVGNAFGMQNLVAMNQELGRFMMTRAQKNTSMLGTLASCKSSGEFGQVCRQAASDMVHDYADEFDKMLDMSVPAPDDVSA